MRNVFVFSILISLVSCVQKESQAYRIQVGDGFLVNQPATIDVSQLEGSDFELRYQDKPVTSDYDVKTKKLTFVHKAENSGDYTLVKLAESKKNTPALEVKKENGNLQLRLQNKPVVQYRYEMNYPPKGVDSIFKKSGYIHPIITPKGDTLSRINPPDHWHHYGLWGPWTHTRIDTTRVDFWNLGDGMGTVLFKAFKNTHSGNSFATFTASQEHIDFKTQKTPQVALNEDLIVKLRSLNREDRYMLDYTTTFTTPLKTGILFEAYRYGGGLGMRFTERWHKDNCEVLTSEGKNRLEADGTNARWAIVKGASTDGKGTSGILFMSYPKNRMHPEPMRVWPIDGNNGRGDMFFEFCPIRHKEWQIEPNKNYELKYRMVVFDGNLTAEEAEAYWQVFAHPLETKPSIN